MTKLIRVKLRRIPARSRPTVEMRQFHVQYCRLQFVEPEIAADKPMSITRFHPVLTANPQPMGGVLISAYDESGVSGRAQIFRRIETEAAGVAHCASLGWSAIEREIGTDGLRGIFDQKQIMPPRDREHFIHLAAQTEKVNRN